MSRGARSLARTRGRLLSNADVASKVAWEGGVSATIGYGLDPVNFEDKELAAAWTQATNILAKINHILEPYFEEA